MTWLTNPWTLLRLAIVALLIRRIVSDVKDVSRGKAPATRLLVPALVLVVAVLVANHFVPRFAAVAALFLLDLVFLIFCIRVGNGLKRGNGPLEQRLETALCPYFPLWFARLVGVELTILGHVTVGVKAFINPVTPSTTTYVHGAKVMLGALIISVAAIPDFVLTAFLVPAHLWPLRIVLDILEAYACAWLFGIFGTMVARPHEIFDDSVVLRNGIFHAATIKREDVLSARALGIVKKRRLPVSTEPSVVMCAGGIPVVEVTLREMTQVRSIFSLRPRQAKTVYFSSDRAENICRLLTAERLPPSSSAAGVS